MTSRVCLVALAAAVVLAAGCGDARRAGVAGAEKRVCAAGSERRVGGDTVAWAAVAVRPTVAYAGPGGRVLGRFGLVNVNRFPTVFGVVSEKVDARCRPVWLHVELPMRPNGITGWIRARDVDRVPVHARIAVDLSERRVRLYERGRLVLSSRAAIGSSATPTPPGRYYVNQRLVPADPRGPFGPGAIGISAFSPVLTGWTQGGPIALHGTNEPWSIGRAVSNGCIRLRNDVLRRLWRTAVAGTPVVIRE